jgi:hypothetical protein
MIVADLRSQLQSLGNAVEYLPGDWEFTADEEKRASDALARVRVVLIEMQKRKRGV